MGNRAKVIFLVFLWSLWLLYDYIIFFAHSERLDNLLQTPDSSGVTGMGTAVSLMILSGVCLFIGSCIAVIDDDWGKKKASPETTQEKNKGKLA